MSTTSVLRVMNERAVYEQVRRLGPVSRPEVAAATGLSKPTVSLALANLERTQLVRPVGLKTGGAGRAAMLYEVRPEAGWVMAVDVGLAYVRVALATLTGEIVIRRDEESRAQNSASLIEQLRQITTSVAEEAGAEPTLTVIGTPGVHDPLTGALRLAPNMPGWNHAGAVTRLQDAVGSRIVIENDIDLAALGERAYGLGQGVRNFVFVSIGTGIGMGVVIEGKLYRGRQGAAGEISYMPVGESDPAASRGRGFLESVASADGVIAMARRLGMKGNVTAKSVFTKARGGDALAMQVLAAEADHVAHALGSIIAVLDPELVILGGGIGAHAGDLLVGPVEERLHDLVALQPPRIEVTQLGDDAIVLGALATGLENARDLVLSEAVGGAF